MPQLLYLNGSQSVLLQYYHILRSSLVYTDKENAFLVEERPEKCISLSVKDNTRTI
jgi:hypothetical protein